MNVVDLFAASVETVSAFQEYSGLPITGFYDETTRREAILCEWEFAECATTENWTFLFNEMVPA